MPSMLALLLALTADPGTPLAPPPLPVIGSETVVPTGLGVPRPPTRPCVVDLFAEQEFHGEARVPIAYAPSPECPGPWAKVVFEGDFRVTAGEQYDRTGAVMLAGVNLFTGTTMEPRRALAPAWHVERDVTDYAPLFAAPRMGVAMLTNYVDARYTGRLFWRGRLFFYPATAGKRPPAGPDLVMAMTPAPATIDAANPAVTATLRFPRNLERLMIDVLAQPQGDDEFWWFCTIAPQDGRPGCGAPFRDVEVSIDGRLAGLAAAYPWIYTGGVNPRMWSLAPGVEALDLSPTRLDLTPFASLVNDGKPHAVTLRVVGAKRYFVATGTLLGWRDAGRAVVTGALDTNTLASAALTTDGTAASDAKGITTRARRDGRIVGHVDTSHGRITTSVTYRLGFHNRQSGTDDAGRIDQQSDVETIVDTRDPAGRVRRRIVDHYPLLVEMDARREGSDRITDTHFRQGLMRSDRRETGGRTVTRTTGLTVEPRVHLVIPPSGRRDAKGQATTVTNTRIVDSVAGCYDRSVTITDNRVAAVRQAADCR